MRAAGTVEAYAPPAGAGVRVESALYTGYAPSIAFDPLLLKIIATAPHSVAHHVAGAIEGGGGAIEGDGGGGDGGAWQLACRRLLRACGELHLRGSLATDVADVCAIVQSDTFARGEWTTGMVDAQGVPSLPPPPLAREAKAATVGAEARAALLGRASGVAGGDGGTGGGSTAPMDGASPPPPPDGCSWVVAPHDGVVVGSGESVAGAGDRVGAGSTLVVLSAMKLEHTVKCPHEGTLEELCVASGQHVRRGQPIALLRASDPKAEQTPTAGALTLGGAGGGEADGEQTATGGGGDSATRPDLARVLQARHELSDAGRAAAATGGTKFAQKLAARHARGQLSARENVAALLDADAPFLEYGRHAVAAQRGRSSLEELRARTPADGLVCGVGAINGAAVGAAAARAAVAAYDATVLAGTQVG